MGQTVKLRRSAVSGKKPLNSQLELGELSANTTDGKLFFAKSGSNGPSVEEIITTDTVNTGSVEISGSFAVTGSITGTEFTGSALGLTDVPLALSGSDAADQSIDGTFTRIKFDDTTGIKISGTTGGDATVYLSGVASESEGSEGRTAKLEVTSATSTWTLNHNLNEKHPAIEVFDSNDEVIIPQKIEATSVNQVVVTFTSPQTGTLTATVGGGLPTIESGYAGRVLAVDGSGVATWKNTILSGSVDFSTLTDTGSFNTYTSSADGRLDSLETTSGSHDGRLDSLETTSGSHNGRLDSIESFTGSINDTYATDSDVTTLRNDLNTYTSSNDTTNTTQNGRLGSLETESGSIRSNFNSYTSSNDTTNTTQNSRLSSIETFTSSIDDTYATDSDVTTLRNDLNTYTSSNDSTNTTQNSRLSSLETNSGSQATSIGNLETFQSNVESGLQFTGSNVTIKGDLLVKGTETRVDSTTVDIADNIISLNGTGATNAGIEVRDTESPGVLSGSLIYDTGENKWKGGLKGSELRLLDTDDLGTINVKTSSIDSRLSHLENESGSVRSDFNSYTSSNDSTNTTQNNRLGSLETKTGSLDTLNTTQNNRLESLESETGSISLTQTIQNNRLNSIEGFTGSIDDTYATDEDVTTLRDDLNTYTSSNDSTNTSQNNRLGSLETKTGSLDTKNSTQDGRLDSIETFTGSLDATFASDADVTTLRNDLNTYTSSNDSTNTTQNSRLGSLETESGSIRSDFNSYTSSNDSTNTTQNSRLGSIETFTSSINDNFETHVETFNDYTASNDSDIDTITGTTSNHTSRLSSLETKTGSLDSTNTTQNNRLGSLETKTGSLDSTNTTQNNRLGSLETKTGSLDTDISTMGGRVTSLEEFTASLDDTYATDSDVTTLRGDLNTYTSSNDSTNTTQNSRLTSIESTTSSHDGRLDSLESTSSSHDGRLDTIEGGLQFTGSNVTVKGNLLVKGTETRVNSTTVDISDNIISLNGSGASSAGIEVRDITSPGVLSGSLIWDGSNNQWKGGIKGSETRILLEGDKTTIDNRLGSLETKTGSLDTKNSTQDGRLDSIESATGSYLTSYNNEYTTGATFNSSNGVVTFTRNDGDTFTVDLDGRYLTSVDGQSVDNPSAVFDNNGVPELRSGITEQEMRTLIGLGSVQNQALSSWTGQGGSLDNQYITNTQGYITGFTDTNISTTGATFNSSNGVVTFTKNNNDTYTVDIDGRFALSNHNHDDRYYLESEIDNFFDGTTSITGYNRTNWNTAYGWGDHSQAGYLTSYNNEYTTGATFNTSNGLITFTRNDGDTFTVDIDGRFLTSFTETDPVFSASPSAGITDTNIENWNTAYGWGDHSQAGYLTSHPNISAASSSNNSGRTYIQDILVDSNGHITGITTATETVVNTDTNIHTTGATFNTSDGVVTFTNNEGDTYTVDLDGRYLTSYNNEYTTGATFNSSNGVITFTRNDGDTFTVDIDGRFLTSFTETDPVFSASPSAGITDTNISNWNTAYGWGDHSQAGYLTSYTESDTLDDVTGRGSSTSNSITTGTHTISMGGTPTLKLKDTSNGGAGGASGLIVFNNTGGDSIGIGTTNDEITNSDLIISTDAGSTYGGYLGLDANAITDTQSDIILDPKTKVKVTGDISMGTNTITDTKVGQWDTAYGWGDHSQAGYLTSHPNISAASSSNNSGRTYIQDILVDSNGHVTGITTATETVVNTDTNIHTTGATFNTSNGVVTFTNNEGDTYTVDLDGRYLTSYNNEYTTGATFNGSNGIITFTRNDGDTFTVDISSTLVDVNVTGGTYNDSSQTLTLNKSDGNSINVTGFAVDTVLHTTGATFNTSDGVITFTKNGGDTYTVDLDGRYALSGHNHDSTYLKLAGGTLTGGLNGTTGTFSGKGTFDNLELTSGNRHLTITQSSDDWFIYNVQQDNGIVIYNGTGGVEIHYSGSSIADFDSTGITLRDNVTMAGSSTIDMGTNTITDTKVGQWDTAYGWGDHSGQGYLTSYNNEYTTGATFSTSTGVITFTRNDGDTFTVDIDGRFLTSYTETDTLANVTSRGATTTDNITTGHHTIKSGNTNKQSRHLLYIGGDGLASADASIYLGNHGNGGGYGWELFYEGSGSGNANAFILRAEGLGTSVDTMKVLQDGTVTFVNNITTSGTITASGGNSGNWNTAYGWGDHSQAGYLTSYNNEYTTGATFNSSNGVVTFTRNDGDTFTVDLDGRYLTSFTETYTQHDNINAASSSDNSGRTYVQDILLDSNGHVTGITTASESVVNTDEYTTGATFNTSNGVITFTRNDGDTFTVDVDGRYLLDSTDTFTGALTIVGDIRGNGSQLVLNAGESAGYATGQTGERIYLNAEAGITVSSSPDNWASGWSGKKESSLTGTQLTIDSETLTKTNIQNFKTAYGWGNHASGGYLTSSSTLNASKMTTGTLPDVMSNTTRYNIGYIDGVSVDSRDKIRVWGSSSYTIGMKAGYDYGHLGSGEYAMSFQMNDNPGRGWWWGHDSHTDDQGAMALTTDGELVVAKSVSIGEGETVTSPSETTLYVEGTTSGSTVFDVQGTQGQLFSVTDDLTGDLFEVSDISGIPILTVNASGTVTVDDTLNVTGDVIAYFSSDERLKDNVKPIENAIDKLKLIGGYEFDWNSSSKNEGHDVGVIAQEVEKVLPEVVTTRSNGYKAVKYEKLTSLLIQANKELIEKVEELEKKINDN